MKFDKVFNKSVEPVFVAEPHHDESPLIDVYDYKLYNNIAIYIMKLGVKGNFKTIAAVINNGNIAPSWAIRIYCLNNEWTLHFATHPNLSTDYNLRDEVETVINDPSITVLGHNHVAMITSPHKSTIESVINKLIDFYKDKKLPNIESQQIDTHYSVNSETSKYKIPTNFKNIESVDEETYRKYLIIIKRLIDDNDIPENDKNEIIRISKRLFKSKFLTKRDFDQLNKYSEKYIDQHTKIKIALQYILSSKK